MKLWIGVTDNDWFRFLRSLSGVEEVNFWRPGGKGGFKALPPDGLFLFKIHYPENLNRRRAPFRLPAPQRVVI